MFLNTAASGVRCFFVIYLDDSLLSEPPRKESACTVGDLGSIPRLGRSPGRGHGNPLQYSCLENPMDRGDWGPRARGVAESRIRLSELALSTALRRLQPHLVLCFALLSFTDTAFSQLNVCGNPASSKSIGSIFPTAFPPLCLCHILVIPAKFLTLHQKKIMTH